MDSQNLELLGLATDEPQALPRKEGQAIVPVTVFILIHLVSLLEKSPGRDRDSRFSLSLSTL